MLGHRKLEVGDYVSILKRRRWLIALPAVVFPICAVIYASFLPARYLSQTLVLVEEQKVPDDIVRSVVSADLNERLASMREQILSRSHVQPIVERYNLYGTSHMDMDDRIDAARKDIEIKPIHSETGGGGLPGFFIAFTAADPRTAQLVCGEITSLFTNENLRSRESAAEGTTDFLKSQLADAKRNLDDQDAKLAAFQAANGGRLPTEQVGNQSMLNSLNTQLEAVTEQLARMEQDRSYEQAMLTQQSPDSTSIGSTVAPDSPDMLKKEQELESLQTEESDLTSRYTADYPDVVAVRRKIADLQKELAKPAKRTTVNGKVVPSQHETMATAQLRSQIHASDLAIAGKRDEQERLQQQVREYQGRISSSPQVEEQYKDLTRDYDTAMQFYNSLLGKMNESKMATDLELRNQGEQFRVMDEPNLPDAPSFPNKVLFAMGGVGFGLALGIGLAAFLEYKDTSLRSEQDVWAFTRLPTLAVLPYSIEVAREDNAPRFWRIRRLLGMAPASTTPKEPLTDSGS